MRATSHFIAVEDASESDAALDTGITNLWRIDSLGVQDSPDESQGDSIALELFKNGVSKKGERYKVPLIIQDPGRRAPKALPEMNLQVQFNPIPRTDHIRILGMHLQANGSNTISLQRIDQSVVQIGRLLKRVSNKRRGMRESNLLRLVQAFICSRITYSAPYLRLTRAESERLETTLRKAYKIALGLPMSTATHKLMALGITNTDPLSSLQYSANERNKRNGRCVCLEKGSRSDEALLMAVTSTQDIEASECAFGGTK
ncbi:hypothetical protein MTO96_006163 [Rhipicephalus appendiculatus]